MEGFLKKDIRIRISSTQGVTVKARLDKCMYNLDFCNVMYLRKT